MKPTLRACALTLALTATFTWAQSQSSSTTASSTTTGSTGTGTTSASTVANPSTTATAAEAASTAPSSTAPAVATSPAGATPGTTITPAVGATTTPPPTGTTPPPGMVPAVRPIVPSRAADVSGTASSSASDVQGTAANPNAQVRSGSGLTTAPQDNVSQPAAGAVAAETNADGQRIGGGGSMAVGIPQQPGTTPGMAAAPGSVASGTSDPALTPNVGPSSTNTVAYLRAAELPQREAALSRVEAQLLETNRAVARLPQVPANLPVTSQVEFAAAMQELQAREAQLRISLLQAQQADEEGWVEARNRLAFDYDAFTNALLRARAAGNTDPTAAAAVAE